MSISPTEEAGTPIYSKEEVEGEYPILGLLLKTLSKGLDGYDFFGLLFEVTMPGLGTTLCVPNEVQWMRKDTLIPSGPDEFIKLTSGFVYFNILVTVSGSGASAASRPIHIAYIQETGEIILFIDGREGLFMYLMQNGFAIPVQEESNGSNDSGDDDSGDDDNGGFVPPNFGPGLS